MVSGIKKVAKPLGSVAKVGLSMVPLPQAQLASNLLGALGAGKGKKSKCQVCKRVKCKCMEGNGFFGDMVSGIKKVAKPLGSVAKVGLSMVPLPQAQLASNLLGALGAGKGKKSKCQVCKRVKCKCMEGNGFLGDMVSGIKKVAKPLGSVAKVGLSMVPLPQAQLASNILGALGAGKKNMEGKGFLGDVWKGVKSVAKPLGSVAKVGLSMVPLPQAQLASNLLGALGAGKKRGRPSKMKGGKLLVPVENMKSSSMAGQGKPKNNRSEIVKNIMKEKGMSMIGASKYVKEHNLY